MATIQDLIAEMKDMAELQKFTEQQYKTILELNKKIVELQTEIATLKTSSLSANPETMGIPGQDQKPSEQMICEVQLALLNNLSMQRELTAEESKKMETYAKVLATFRSKEKAPEKAVEKVDTATLIKLFKDEPQQA